MFQILGIIGWHDSGKTTLAVELVRALKARGLRVAVIKHSMEGFEIDRAGTDTWRLREAGSDLVVISSRDAMAWIEQRQTELSLGALLGRVPQGIDLVIVEGFKREPIPKIEVLRTAANTEPIASVDELVAIVSDGVSDPRPVPQYRFEDIEGIITLLGKKGLVRL